ncbi:MAG: 16S rRNA (adenine(1518)-N(6)/adenine(1519)-N(6))-dimethyltransferase RsmA [Chloroflexi bacterium]|nr:16S rRNA (adenine(1518)-N(6)/adenine(1519)-N(6))-dimethyltransferase RsmA [Chloroflexota bacterium]
MPAIKFLNVPVLLRQHGLRPNKAMGQNFLVDEGHLSRIVEAAGAGNAEEVLEVGAGLGSLTRYVAAIAKRVVAVELDGKLLPILRETIAGQPNVQVVHGDIMQLRLADFFQSPGYLVVANIPYYLTSNLIRHLLAQDPRPARLALTIQREVAERACAMPPEMSLLALSVQLYGSPRIAHHIPAGAFYPSPKVDSALLLVDLYPEPRLPTAKIGAFFKLAKAAFSQKRKTLANSLAALPGWTKEQAAARLEASGVDPRRRPQTLTLEEWGRLL